MNKEEIISILEDWNYWSKPLKKTFSRQGYEQQVLHKSKADEIIILKGVRRSGKSTILLNHLKNIINSGIAKEQILFVNLEDPRFATYLSVDLLEDIKNSYLYYLNPTDKPYIFLDEVQNIDNFEKWLLKEYELNLSHLFVTGSNSKLLSKEIGSSLSGRYLDIEMFPLSFEEFLSFKSCYINTKYDFVSKKTQLEKYFEEFMQYGGFPKVVLTDDIELKEAELKSYFDSILLRDIVARYKLDNFRALEQLSIFLLSSISNQISINKIKNHLGVSFDLANRYFEYLQNTYLIQQIYLFDWSYKKQISNPKKIYSVDVGLSKIVSFEVGQRLGDILENIVFLELRRRYNEIYYFKTSQNYEVDFLIKNKQKITHLIQVSQILENQKTKQRELRALIKAKNELKASEDAKLYIITMDDSSVEIIDNNQIYIINILEWLVIKDSE